MGSSFLWSFPGASLKDAGCKSANGCGEVQLAGREMIYPFNKGVKPSTICISIDSNLLSQVRSSGVVSVLVRRWVVGIMKPVFSRLGDPSAMAPMLDLVKIE
jgi:hypothetical protein